MVDNIPNERRPPFQLGTAQRELRRVVGIFGKDGRVAPQIRSVLARELAAMLAAARPSATELDSIRE
jgi:hypothetical protein